MHDRRDTEAPAATSGSAPSVDVGVDDLFSAFSTLLEFTTAAEFDLAEALRRLAEACVRFSGADVAGVLLLDREGTLQPAAVSEDTGPMAALFAGRTSGPCETALAQGAAVSIPDLAAEAHRWPAFAARALAAGVGSVHALPMHREGVAVGSVKLLYAHPTSLEPETAAALQTFADIASVAFLVRDNKAAVTQLQTAIQSRAVIEQAKGVLMAVASLPPERAFEAIRSYARNHNLRVAVVAQGLVSGSLPAQRVVANGR